MDETSSMASSSSRTLRSSSHGGKAGSGGGSAEVRSLLSVIDTVVASMDKGAGSAEQELVNELLELRDRVGASSEDVSADDVARISALVQRLVST
jgi:hypothetical protein